MSRNEDYVVRFSGVKSGSYRYEMELDNAFFDAFKNEEIEDGKVEYIVVMERTERVTMLHFSFSGWLTTRCDRCLEPLKIEVSGEEALNIRFSDTEESTDENTVVLPEDAYQLDLSPWLYEYVAVRIPLQHSHPEGDCNPETTRYLDQKTAPESADYVDPRWEALMKLK